MSVLDRYFRRFHPKWNVLRSYEDGHTFMRCSGCGQTMCSGTTAGGEPYVNYHLEAEGHRFPVAHH